MAIVTTHLGKRFEAQGAESLLDAALRQGIQFAHSCRTGRCSTCKGRVDDLGATTLLGAELGLKPEEQAQGWVLTCVRSAREDLRLQAEDLGDVELFPAQTLPSRIDTLERLADDVLRVVLRLPPAAELCFHPGQYVDVIGAGGLRRSYSLANAPRQDRHLELHIREVPGGEMSRYWFDAAKPGDLLRLRGPLGTFFLRDIGDRDLVLLATGTGIAPVKAMLEGLARFGAPKPRSISVLWGGRVPADLYWQRSDDLPRHAFTGVLSRADAQWTGERGHVQQALLLQGARDWNATRVYACGSDAMIHGARKLLIEAGLAADHFHSDAFVCSAPT